jgi:hypothetical protein
MAQESDNGIAYLTALRQAASSATTQPPQHSEATDAMPGANNAGERFEGAEKRRAPRYKCEGSAEIREDGKDVRTWATFSDISIHGCYVEAQATYPAGTILHMKLDANGVRFETEAIVRVSYPYLGMGIAFTERCPVAPIAGKSLASLHYCWAWHRLFPSLHRSLGSSAHHHRSRSSGSGADRFLRKSPDADAG